MYYCIFYDRYELCTIHFLQYCCRNYLFSLSDTSIIHRHRTTSCPSNHKISIFTLADLCSRSLNVPSSRDTFFETPSGESLIAQVIQSSCDQVFDSSRLKLISAFPHALRLRNGRNSRLYFRYNPQFPNDS